MILNCPTTNNPTGSNTQGEPINTAITDKGNNDGTVTTKLPDGTATTQNTDGGGGEEQGGTSSSTITPNQGDGDGEEQGETEPPPPPTINYLEDQPPFGFEEFDAENGLCSGRFSLAQNAYTRVNIIMQKQATTLISQFPEDGVEVPTVIKIIHHWLGGMEAGLKTNGSIAPGAGMDSLHKALLHVSVSCDPGSTADRFEKAVYYTAHEYPPDPATSYINEVNGFLESIRTTGYANYVVGLSPNKDGTINFGGENGLISALYASLKNEIEDILPVGNGPDGTSWKSRAQYLVNAIKDNREFAAFVDDLKEWGYDPAKLKAPSTFVKLSQMLDVICKVDAQSNGKVL